MYLCTYVHLYVQMLCSYICTCYCCFLCHLHIYACTYIRTYVRMCHLYDLWCTASMHSRMRPSLGGAYRDRQPNSTMPPWPMLWASTYHTCIRSSIHTHIPLPYTFVCTYTQVHTHVLHHFLSHPLSRVHFLYIVWWVSSGLLPQPWAEVKASCKSKHAMDMHTTSS